MTLNDLNNLHFDDVWERANRGNDISSRKINRAQGYKTFSYSTQLSIKFFMLINVKMPTDSFTFMSMKISVGVSFEPEKC